MEFLLAVGNRGNHRQACAGRLRIGGRDLGRPRAAEFLLAVGNRSNHRQVGLRRLPTPRGG